MRIVAPGGHFPQKCTCFEDIRDNVNVFTACFGLSTTLACGSIMWKCPECSKISTANLFQRITSKLNKIDENSKDLELLKSQIKNERCKTYANIAKRDAVELPKSQISAEPSVQSSDSYTNGAKNNTVGHGSLNPFLLRNQRRGSIYLFKLPVLVKKTRCFKVEMRVVTGTASASTIKRVKSTDRKERRHYFLRRVPLTSI